MAGKKQRKRELKKLMETLIEKVYYKETHVPSTKTDVLKNIVDFAILEKILKRVLLRRDRP